MKIYPLLLLFMTILLSCNKDKELLDSFNQSNIEMETTGYHLGDEIKIPDELLKESSKINVNLGEEEISTLKITPDHYRLGQNAVTFFITKKNGEVLQQDANINVYAKNNEKNLRYKIVAEYPHDPQNFVQGFQLEGNTIYESDGQKGESRLIKYTLGSTNPMAENKQSDDIFSEGSTIVGDKIYQLTWQNKIGFIYQKNDLKKIGEFSYNNRIGEGWGITYDGKNLITSDGSANLYFLDPNSPTDLIRYISVAGSNASYTSLNELEYHQGFIYANVWQQNIILKIDPKFGEVVAVLDLSEIVKENQKSTDDVLNGISFKNENMLITGKNWDKIYELSIY